MKLLGISTQKNHIIFSSLSFKAKFDISICLLHECDHPNKDEIIMQIRKIPNIAKRNHIAHSLITGTPDMSHMIFWKRDISRGLQLKRLDFTTEEMEEHFLKFTDASKALQEMCGITQEDFQLYFNAIKPPH